jgi:hypothetical protein
MRHALRITLAAVMALAGCSGESSSPAAGAAGDQSETQTKTGPYTPARAGSQKNAQPEAGTAVTSESVSKEEESPYAGPAGPYIAKLGSSDSAVCDKAAERLIDMGEAAVDALIAALKDRDGHIRADAAWVLGQIGDKRAVEPLIEAVRDGSAKVRSYAALALGKLGDKRAIPALREALDDRDEDVRQTAQPSLDKLEPQEKTEPAREHAGKTGRTPEEVVRAYLEALKAAKWDAMYDFLTKDAETAMATALAAIRRMPEPEKLKGCRDMGITSEKLDALTPREFFILMNTTTMKYMAGTPYEKAFFETGDMEVESCKVDRDWATAEIVHRETKRKETVNLRKEDGLWKIELRKK